MDDTGLTGVRQGTSVVGGPVGTEYFKLDFLQKVINGESAELARVLVLIEDAQASFQILRLFTAFRLSHLLRKVPPSIAHQAAADYDALSEWALASITAGDGAAVAGLPISAEVAYDLIVRQIRPTWDTNPYGRPSCPSENATLALPAAPSKAQSTSIATP